MPESGVPISFDTVTLSNFALAERLDLLVERYGQRVHVTTQVQDELAEGVSSGYDALREALALVEQGAFSSVALTVEDRIVFLELLRNLSIGEASCIAGAASRGGRVATDDRVARAVCAERNLAFTGTLGILKACCREGAVSPGEADGILDRMVEHGFYSPIRRISDMP